MNLASILETILNLASSGVLGIVLVSCFAVGGIIVGLCRKTFMQLWDLLIFAIIFAVSYFVLMSKLGDWICDKAMLQFGLNTTVVVDGVEVYRIDTFSDLISFLCRLTEDVRFTEEYAVNMAHSITYAMAFALLMLADLIVAPILSLITWPLIKLAIPKSWDHANKRFVGPLISLVEVALGFSIIINCFSAYSEGMSWIINNPMVLSNMNVDTSVFKVLKFFTTDFFGALKVLNLPIFNFQFGANGQVYTTSVEFAYVATKVFPKDGNAELLAEAYKARLLELWMAEHGVSMPPKDVIKLAINRITAR